MRSAGLGEIHPIVGDLRRAQHRHAIVRLCGEDVRDQTVRVAEALFGELGLTKVGGDPDALDAAYTQKGRAQFKSQTWIVVSSCGKPLKIIARHVHDLLPNLSAAGHASQIPLDVQQLVGEAANLIEPAFRYSARALGDDESARQKRHRKTCCRNSSPMAAEELACTIPAVGGTRSHGPEFEKSANVIREGVRGRVSLVRSFAERFAEDMVDV